MNSGISPINLYRLPWNLTDNTISWLEPTSKCNLRCDGCYRENRPNSHKSLEEIRSELEVFASMRRSDSISIAGGEPLTHPNIIDIIAMIREFGWKPVINSNGALLTSELLKELKKAGVYGFTFHVDSRQGRPGWKDADEIELCELRTQLADMLYRHGKLSCSFNATVYPETLKFAPHLVEWAQKNIDKVHVSVFIIYRLAVVGKEFDYYKGGQKVDSERVTYSTDDVERRKNITSLEVVEEIRKKYPDFMPCAYLNGTVKPDSYKWLLASRLGNKHEIFGYAGPKFMEIVQAGNHLINGKYLAYSKPSTLRRGRALMLLSPFDKGIRQASKNYLNSFWTNSKAFFSRLHTQSVMIIQPIDFMPNGDTNMCDGCPDMTVWNGQLVWSCRMEEQYLWGENLRVAPRVEEK